jgi:hypothetical protein
MERFNKYAFLGDLQDLIEESNSGDVYSVIHQEIDNECIYYSDCFQIIEACGMIDWKENEFGDITNIQQLAFVALYDFVIDNLEVPA